MIPLKDSSLCPCVNGAISADLVNNAAQLQPGKEAAFVGFSSGLMPAIRQ